MDNGFIMSLTGEQGCPIAAEFWLQIDPTRDLLKWNQSGARKLVGNWKKKKNVYMILEKTETYRCLFCPQTPKI